ncbi:hypothetical protein [Streptosporangium sp. NPDC000509]|uniref:hypothetical protein n=1 Tax=Streptosporangium sp. NPDC000509 TaxID=3366186 RepID=UPI0036762B9A
MYSVLQAMIAGLIATAALILGAMGHHWRRRRHRLPLLSKSWPDDNEELPPPRKPEGKDNGHLDASFVLKMPLIATSVHVTGMGACAVSSRRPGRRPARDAVSCLGVRR